MGTEHTATLAAVSGISLGTGLVMGYLLGSCAACWRRHRRARSRGRLPRRRAPAVGILCPGQVATALTGEAPRRKAAPWPRQASSAYFGTDLPLSGASPPPSGAAIGEALRRAVEAYVQAAE